MASINVKLKNLDKVLKNIQDVFDRDLVRQGMLEKIRDFAVLRIQAETRKGKDLSRDGKEQDPLSDNTISIRRAVASGKRGPDKYGGFIPDKTFFRVTKSNLTSTGQLLDSLEGDVDRENIQITIGPSGSRDASLQYDNKIRTNIELAKDLAKRGRTFLGLDSTGVVRIKKMVLDEIRRIVVNRGFKG